MTVTATRRKFNPEYDARRFVMLLDERTGRLLEIIGMRGIRGTDTPLQVLKTGEIRVLDASRNLPDDPFDALDEAEWIPVAEARELVVVVPISQDSVQ